MSLRLEFVQMAMLDGANMSELCRRFGISRKPGYKWVQRYRQGGPEALQDESRRPHHSPSQTASEIEDRIVALRKAHPAWGGAKIHAYMKRKGEAVPKSPNTVTAVLHRHEQIDPEESAKHQAFHRFEKEKPNDLWQMDFKGYFAMSQGGDCHPLTVLDDHSRFLVGIRACPNENRQTVQSQLTGIFRPYGLPECIIMDNGSPWSDDWETRHTIFTSWLIRLGITVSHSRPCHPQTMGKDERLHRTLKAELLSQREIANLDDAQAAFDLWQHEYNYERPHESLEMESPASRYHPSARPFPESLPPVVYDHGLFVRKVDTAGRISFQNKPVRIGKAFRGQPVGLEPTETDGVFTVYYCQQEIKKIDLRD